MHAPQAPATHACPLQSRQVLHGVGGGPPASLPVLTPAGTLDVALDTLPGCSKAFGTLERDLRERRAIRDGLVGRAPAQLLDGRAVVEATIARLARDPHALLCTDPACHRCSMARLAGGEH